MDRLPFFARTAGVALDNLPNHRFANLDQVMGLVGEPQGFQAEPRPLFHQAAELDVGGQVLLADVAVGIIVSRVTVITE